MAATPACAQSPTFTELEASGAVIGAVRVHIRNIFDLDIPGEDRWAYGLVNSAHVTTRPRVIERMLLFASGEKVSVRKIDETERLLRTLRLIHDVEIRPVGYDGQKVDIDVITRDTWTLDFTGSFSRTGGDNRGSFGIRERNLLGTGLGFAYSRVSNTDRNGTELELAYNQAFDGWTHVEFDRGKFNDGKRTAFAIERPFYSFETRRAARAAWSDEDRIDAIYNAGDKQSEFRHKLQSADLSAGWSPGLVNGWTQRLSAGLALRDDAYQPEPGRELAIPLPVDHRVRSVFLRHEWVQEDFLRVINYNRIARPEFLEVGFHSDLQLSRALRALGSTRNDWLFAAKVSDGARLASGATMQGQVSVERRISSIAEPLVQAGTLVRWYLPVGSRTLYYASLSADRVSGGGVADQLMLGGEEGLRGYPSRYQAGENRVLATSEYRVYADWYPYRLIRVGAAAFFDVGRAWRGPNQNASNGGWLADAGVGLRIALDRAAHANVLHLDIAVPLNRAPGIRSVQFVAKTEFGF